MKILKPMDVGRSLADAVLHDAMRRNRPKLMPITKIQYLVEQEHSVKLLKIYLRAQREAIGRILALTLVQSIDKLESDFVRGHFRDARSIHYLALRLPIQERQLYTVKENILRRLASLLSYRMSAEDVFHPCIALNLLNVLDVRIGTILLLKDYKTAEGLLSSLYDARRRCRAILSLQQRFLDHAPIDDYERTVQAKFRHPFFATQQLTDALPEVAKDAPFPSRASKVYMYLKRFTATAEQILGDKKGHLS